MSAIDSSLPPKGRGNRPHEEATEFAFWNWPYFRPYYGTVGYEFKVLEPTADFSSLKDIPGFLIFAKKLEVAHRRKITHNLSSFFREDRSYSTRLGMDEQGNFRWFPLYMSSTKSLAEVLIHDGDDAYWKPAEGPAIWPKARLLGATHIHVYCQFTRKPDDPDLTYWWRREQEHTLYRLRPRLEPVLNTKGWKWHFNEEKLAFTVVELDQIVWHRIQERSGLYVGARLVTDKYGNPDWFPLASGAFSDFGKRPPEHEERFELIKKLGATHLHLLKDYGFYRKQNGLADHLKKIVKKEMAKKANER